MSQTAISSYCIIFICYWNGTERFNDGDGILGPKSAVPNLWDGFSPYSRRKAVLPAWTELVNLHIYFPNIIIIFFRKAKSEHSYSLRFICLSLVAHPLEKEGL